MAHRDPNPRGGTARREGRVGARRPAGRLPTPSGCSSSTPGSVARSTITHPLAGAIHDVLAVEAGIWVTCADLPTCCSRSTGTASSPRPGPGGTDAVARVAPSASTRSRRSTCRPRPPRPACPAAAACHNVGHLNGGRRARSDGLLVGCSAASSARRGRAPTAADGRGSGAALAGVGISRAQARSRPRSRPGPFPARRLAVVRAP